MATGDPIAARILGSADFAGQYNGCAIAITFEGLGDGGTHKDMGWNAYHVILESTPKITISGTTYTFNSSQVVTPTSFTGYVTKYARQEYPDQTLPEDEISGSDFIIYYWISGYVYNDDYDISVTLLADVYEDLSSNSTNAGTIGVTNDSSQNPGNPCAKWTYPGYNILDSASVTCRATGFQRDAQGGQPIKYMEFTVEDEHSHSFSYVLDEAQIDSGMTDDLQSIIEYYHTFDLSSFTNGDVIAKNFKAYGWRTDSTGTYGVLDTSDAVNSQPTPQYAPQTAYLMTTVSAIGHCCVDKTNGSDITGTVYTSQSTAESAWSGDNTTAFQTIPAALTALASYHSWSDAGGGYIYLTQESHDLNTANGGASYSAWITIQPMTGGDNEDTFITIPATNAQIPNMLKLSNVGITSSNYFNGYAADFFWADKIKFNTSGTVTIYNCPVLYATYCTGTMARQFRAFGGVANPWAIIRGCSMSTLHRGYGYCVVGCNNVGNQDAEAGNPTPYYGIFAFNKILAWDGSDYIPALAMFNNQDNESGYAIIQNLIEKIGAISTAIAIIAGDGNTNVVYNILLWNNTFYGQRVNLAYNETGTTCYLKHLWSQRGNIFDNWNNKSDWNYSPYSANRVGPWSVTNMVDSYGNLICGSDGANYVPEWNGISSIFDFSGDPDFVNDQSGSGGSGNGDYHIGENSDCIELVKEANKCLSFDLEGNARGVNTASGAYEYVADNGLRNLALMGAGR